MTLFFRDASNSITVTWDDLIHDIVNTDTYNRFCYKNNFYEILKHIIVSLLCHEEITLLDNDFTEDELISLTGSADVARHEKPIEKKHFTNIKSKDDLLQKLQPPIENWSITMFTSGTTGLPKKVSHSFQSITRFVRVSEKNISNVWGFAYNPTHIAGTQVFFQALLNGNAIVRLFGLSKDEIYKEIEEFGITNISATPTFYRLMLPTEKAYPSVIRITSGGEKFDEKTIKQLTKIFLNAKITNVYASTEAGTLFASDGDVFSIKPEMMPMVKIENDELFIHNSLMGMSEINHGEWYNTGDLIKIISTDPLKFIFVSRKNEMINVGGYKVNPHEIEETIRSMPGIKDVCVFAKHNSVLGNIICCDIVKTDESLDEPTIRAYLQSRLQEFKIPRMIKFANKLTMTRTGKIKRS